MKIYVAFVCFLTLSFGAMAAVAQNDLYDNGSGNGNGSAWVISLNYAVSDTFLLGNPSTVNGLDFVAWMLPGDTLRNAEVAITSSEFGGTTYFDQMVDFTQGNCTINVQGFNVCLESTTFTGVDLNAGSYWLTISQAEAGLFYWAENAGPSLASENSIGTIPSEAFTVLGHSGGITTPEPTSILLLSTGLLGVTGLVRRKMF